MTQSGHWKETEKPGFTETPEEPPCLCSTSKQKFMEMSVKVLYLDTRTLKRELRRRFVKLSNLASLTFQESWLPFPFYLPNLYMAEVGSTGENKEHKAPNNV